ncbi:hypothetical protein SDC9_130867 [bioreactor metagenome]|uniref:HTH cro/C1-type domain-containing protein n=1 Tax=bioreactor metagenome TaxID=1076179 RepID=A0A645D410_9ZZZZ
MGVSNKIKVLLILHNKKTADLAPCLDISVQGVRNKFTRNSFSADDLIKIADFLDCELAFILSDTQRISLALSDLRQDAKKSTDEKE